MLGKRGQLVPTFAIAIAAVAVAAALAYSFLYLPVCKDEACFKDALWKCNKAEYLNVQENATWLYKIKGLSFGECEVYVKAVSINTDAETGAALQGKEMNCYIPEKFLGAFMPEKRIEYCHGLLKEEMQRLIIEKTHLYIIQNIGQINETILTI